MNRLNEEVLRELNLIFVASNKKRDLLISNMIIETSREMIKEKENGNIFVDLDLETGACAFGVQNPTQLSNAMKGYGSFIALCCNKALGLIDAFEVRDLKDLMAGTSMEPMLSTILKNKEETEGLLKDIKEHYKTIAIEELTNGFKKGMAGESVGRESTREGIK